MPSTTWSPIAFGSNGVSGGKCAQVGADSVIRGLGAALTAADGVDSARPTLEGYALCVRLAGVLGLDPLSTACIDGAHP